MLTAQVVKVELVKGESVKVFEPGNVSGWEKEGYIMVRPPRYEGDPYILHRPSEVLVTWIYQGREITADKKKAIMSAYYKAGKKMTKFTEAAFKRFMDDMHNGRIVPKFSKFVTGDIFFIAK